MKTTDSKLVDAKGLIAEMWGVGSGPGLRSVRRWQANGVIPFVRIGRRIYFDPEAVRQAVIKGGTKARR